MKNTNKMAQYDAPKVEVSLVQVEAGFSASNSSNKDKFATKFGSTLDPTEM